MFNLARADERMRFTLELYNLSSTWHDDGRTAYQIDEFKRAVTDASRELTSFTASKRGLDNPETDAAGGGAASGPMEEQLMVPMEQLTVLIGQLTKQLVAQLDGSKTQDMRWCRTSLR